MKTEDAIREIVREKFSQLSKEELKKIMEAIELILEQKKASKK
jgi:molecular chaperone DnaK (HSP70)